MEVKAMVFIEDFHAHAINDEALVEAAKNKCQDQMMR